jgi:biotin carboxyl carrier protein
MKLQNITIGQIILAIASLFTMAVSVGLATSLMQADAQDSPTGQTELLTLPEELSAPGNNSIPRIFKITFSVTDINDVLIQQGDQVAKGQLLANRARERTRLQTRIERLNISLEKLQQEIRPPLPPTEAPPIAALPSESFLDEIAAIDRARVDVERAQDAVDQQQRKLDALALMDANSVPAPVIPHETAVMESLQKDLDQAIADLALAEARLDQAQADRAHQEYLHSERITQRALEVEAQQLAYQEQMQTYQQQITDREYRIAEVSAQLEAARAELALLEAVRSPYSGTVQRIQFEGQTNEQINVEVSLRVVNHDSDDSDRSDRPSRATGRR